MRWRRLQAMWRKRRTPELGLAGAGVVAHIPGPGRCAAIQSVRTGAAAMERVVQGTEIMRSIPSGVAAIQTPGD